MDRYATGDAAAFEVLYDGLAPRLRAMLHRQHCDGPLTEDLPAQTSCQLMMEAGAVPSVLFGKRESSLTGMHKNYDAAIGHDVEAALRSNSAAMGVR